MKKIVIVLALIGIITWNLPTSLSLFANTHAFYNITAPCYKCHNDVLNQIQDFGYINMLHNTLDSSSGCMSCHIDAPQIRGEVVQEDFHASSRPMCLDCHPNTTTIYGNLEAHKDAVNQANNSSRLIGMNEACRMCHTKEVSVITMPNTVVFAFEFDSVNANNSAKMNGTHNITLINGTEGHNFRDDFSCVMCHPEIQAILNQDGSPYEKHRMFGCVGCHRGSGDNPEHITNETTTNYHSAKIKYCSDCHGVVDFPRDCNQCHTSHGGFKPGMG